MKIVYYLTPSSFCFGVKRSIDQLHDIILKHQGEPIICIHALVHNPKVTQEFKKKGVIFVENINEIKDTNAIIIFSAHGTKRKVLEEAKKKYKAIYNLECPFVSKIYTEADVFLKKGVKKFVYIGKEHHQEGKNVIEHIRDKGGEVIVCEKKENINNITYPNIETFGVLSQTTLNFIQVKELIQMIKKKYPQAQIPILDDVCKATYERQTVILKHLDKFDTLIVIGGKESNNTKELAEIGKKYNKQTLYGESLDDILQYQKEELFVHQRVAITGGASTPGEDIQKVFDYYKKHNYQPQILYLD